MNKLQKPNRGHYACRRGSVTERFESRYTPEPNSGCWLWTAGATSDGYGLMTVDHRYVLAHRVGWMLHKGRIPDDLWVLHKCDTPACVNPDHMFLGTHADNMKDMVAKGRARYISPGGAACGRAKLTEQQAMEIKSSREPPKFFCLKYGISRSTVLVIRKGKTWKDLERKEIQ